MSYTIIVIVSVSAQTATKLHIITKWSKLQAVYFSCMGWRLHSAGDFMVAKAWICFKHADKTKYICGNQSPRQCSNCQSHYWRLAYKLHAGKLG